MEASHPFLNDINHRTLIVRQVNEFMLSNLNLSISQTRTGHLFYGQRAFPFGMLNAEFDSVEKIRFYPSTATSELTTGLILLLDETAHSFDVGIAELGVNDLGIFFEPILINVVIPKRLTLNHRFSDSDYYLQIFEVESFGTLRKLRLADIDLIKDRASAAIYNILLFNVERVSKL
mgnify:CR=1 FL=1